MKVNMYIPSYLAMTFAFGFGSYLNGEQSKSVIDIGSCS